MRKHIWQGFIFTCISFTCVSLVLALFGRFVPGDMMPNVHPLELFCVCATLSGFQVLCDFVPALDNLMVVRALCNMLILFGMGGALFGWFSFAPLQLAFAGGVSILAFVAVWLYANYRVRQDARQINDIIAQKTKPEETGNATHHTG